MFTIRFDDEDHRHSAPYFCLTTADGRRVSLLDFHEASNLVLVFVPEACLDCPRYLREMASRGEEYAGENARLLAVLPKSREQLHAFHTDEMDLLFDPEQAVRREYTGLMAPGLVGEHDLLCFVLDSYGAPYACLAGSQIEPADQDEILSWLRFVGIQCPE